MTAFLVSAALTVWVLAGWPCWLAWRARRSPRPFARDGPPAPVSVLIAVRNGDAHLRRKLESVLALDYPRDCLEIIVASDGSTDQTEAIARELAPRGVRLLALPAAGKPSALNAAIQAATGEILFITDVRQPLEPASLRRLVACFADPRVGAASGDLVLMQGETAGEAAIDAYRRFESWLRIKLSTLDSMFGATGAIYAIRRRLVRPMPADLLLDDSYLPLHAFFQGYRLVFEPEARAYDYPAPVATEFRRKVRTLAGVWQLLKYYPQLLGPANRMWLDFVSYKLGRLLLPFLLLAVAASSFFLPGPWRTAALGAQATGYLAALADPLVPERFALKRLTGPARTFVVMMAAAALAVQVWFVPAQRLWKVTQLAAPGARR